MCCHKYHLEKEEHPGIRSITGLNITCYLARILVIQQSEPALGWTRESFQKSGGSNNLPPIGQHGEIQFTNPTDLLPQIQQCQENYTWITSNGHSRLSKDLATFMLCFSWPKSYKLTAWQYLDNIMSTANYKLTDIIAWALQEESRRKAQAIGSGSSLNKFSTAKNLGQKCAKFGKSNHSTQTHWPGGKHPNMGKGKESPKVSGSSFGNNKKGRQKGRGKERKRHHWVPMY